jgi:allantoinase
MEHGFVEGPMPKLDNQANAIKRAVEAIAKFSGKPPRSWESPGLTETEETIDLLRSLSLRIRGGDRGERCASAWRGSA